MMTDSVEVTVRLAVIDFIISFCTVTGPERNCADFILDGWIWKNCENHNTGAVFS